MITREILAESDSSMTGDLRIDAVKYGTTKAPALLDATGCMTSDLCSPVHTIVSHRSRLSNRSGLFVMGTKKCTRCGETKDVSAFYKDTRARDGLQSYCNACNAQWHQEHSEQAKEYRADHPYLNKRACKKYYAANAEREQQRVSRWMNEHPENHRAADARRRARKRQAGGTHTAEDIKRQISVQKGKCWWCNKPCSDDYHVDHLIPLAQGGHNNPSNIVIACPRCNLSKSDKLPEEWAGKLF